MWNSMIVRNFPFIEMGILLPVRMSCIKIKMKRIIFFVSPFSFIAKQLAYCWLSVWVSAINFHDLMQPMLELEHMFRTDIHT